MVRAKRYCYLLTYKGNINLFFNLLDKLKAKVLAYCEVAKPKHAHAVIMLSQKLDKKLSSKLAKAGCYLNWRFLRNGRDVDKAISYVVENPSLHKSDGYVNSVRFISSNAAEDIRGGGMGSSLEERVGKLEEKFEKLANAFEQLANAVLNQKPASQNSTKQASQPAKVTLKQGRAGYLLFLNSYKIVRGKPMTILSGRELASLKAEIDKLLADSSKNRRVKKKEGFENAIR